MSKKTVNTYLTQPFIYIIPVGYNGRVEVLTFF